MALLKKNGDRGSRKKPWGFRLEIPPACLLSARWPKPERCSEKWGARPPRPFQSASRRLVLARRLTPKGCSLLASKCFGETPKTAGVTPALPKATASFRLRPGLFASQPTGQRHDPVVSDRETVVHQERIGQAGPVERAVNLHGHNGLPHHARLLP